MPDTSDSNVASGSGYERPTLVILGDFTELTQGETGGGQDLHNIAT